MNKNIPTSAINPINYPSDPNAVPLYSDEILVAAFNDGCDDDVALEIPKELHKRGSNLLDLDTDRLYAQSDALLLKHSTED